jgi:hypothetical protein
MARFVRVRRTSATLHNGRELSANDRQDIHKYPARPISLVFDGIINPKSGTTAVINTNPSVVAKTLAGPDFAKATYTDGFVQFSDAVQRAEFQPVRRTNWHTILNRPTMFAPVTIHLPSSVVEVLQLPDGRIFCLLDI